MKLTRKNLEIIHYSLQLALDEVHNQIATCPDHIEYAEDLNKLDRTMEKIRKLMNLIGANLNQSIEISADHALDQESESNPGVPR